MDIHAKIKELCKTRKWKLSKLATEIGISKSTAYDWYNENHFTPSLGVIEDICAVFEISLSQFFSDVDFHDPSPQEIDLLENFRKIPDEKKEAVLTLVKTFADI